MLFFSRRFLYNPGFTHSPLHPSLPSVTMDYTPTLSHAGKDALVRMLTTLAASREEGHPVRCTMEACASSLAKELAMELTHQPSAPRETWVVSSPPREDTVLRSLREKEDLLVTEPLREDVAIAQLGKKALITFLQRPKNVMLAPKTSTALRIQGVEVLIQAKQQLDAELKAELDELEAELVAKLDVVHDAELVLLPPRKEEHPVAIAHIAQAEPSSAPPSSTWQPADEMRLLSSAWAGRQAALSTKPHTHHAIDTPIAVAELAMPLREEEHLEMVRPPRFWVSRENLVIKINRVTSTTTSTTVPWEDDAMEEVDSGAATALISLHQAATTQRSGENAVEDGAAAIICHMAATLPMFPAPTPLTWRKPPVRMSGCKSKEAFFRACFEGRRSRLAVSKAAARLVAGRSIGKLLASGIDRVNFTAHFGSLTTNGQLHLRMENRSTRADMVFSRLHEKQQSRMLRQQVNFAADMVFTSGPKKGIVTFE